MKSKLLSGLLLSCALFAQSALAQRMPVPIVNHRSIPVTASGAPMRAEQVKQAILDGANAKGWKIAEEPGNKMVATLVVRNKHTVMVEIAYSATRYSLVYRDSVNMKYNAEYIAPRNASIYAKPRPSIHPFYNDWVAELKNAIGAELSRVKPAEESGATGPTGIAASVAAPADARLADVHSVPFISERGKNLYEQFLATKRRPRAFAISLLGASNWATGPEAVEKAKAGCEKFGSTCLIYALDDRVLWDGRIAIDASACDPSRVDAKLCDVDAVPVRAEGKDRYKAFLMIKARPRAFIVSEGGGWRFLSGANATGRALEVCKKAGDRCRVYAEDDKVVWDPKSPPYQ